MITPNIIVKIADHFRTIINGSSIFAIKVGVCGTRFLLVLAAQSTLKNTAFPTSTAPGKMCKNLRTAISASMVSPLFLYEFSENDDLQNESYHLGLA